VVASRRGVGGAERGLGTGRVARRDGCPAGVPGCPGIAWFGSGWGRLLTKPVGQLRILVMLNLVLRFSHVVRGVRRAGLGRVGWLGLGCLLVMGEMEGARLGARDFRVNQLPNGQVFRCANCHVNPAGGGPRTPFGNRVFQIIGGSPAPIPFWSASLAAEDSDGDGYCNGEELGDPDGDGQPVPGWTVSNPGVATSRQPNAVPIFEGEPVTLAVQGLPYEYQAVATDSNACQRLTFAKVEGPDWLTVSGGGRVAGVPPEGAAGPVTVTVEVRDSGTPAQTARLTYTLQVVARFEGWQRLYFTLPEESAVAAPEADPDGDGLSNAAEYAMRTNPREANAPLWGVPGFDGEGRLVWTVEVRDDDPGLELTLELSPDLSFADATAAGRTESDPVPGDGRKTVTFRDVESRAGVTTRFGRLRVQWGP